MRKRIVRFLCICLAAVLLSLFVNTSFFSVRLIRLYAMAQDELTFGDVFPYGWDIAYFSGSIYRREEREGEWIRKDSVIDRYALGVADPAEKEGPAEYLLFMKNGVLVKTLRFDMGELYFRRGMDWFTPDTVFEVYWDKFPIPFWLKFTVRAQENKVEV